MKSKRRVKMSDNQTYLDLNKMCSSAKKTAFGTLVNTFIGGLLDDTPYSGELLTSAEVEILDKMCGGSSKGGGLGTIFNALLTASKGSEHIVAISDSQAKILNKLCMSVTKVSDTISEVAYNGIGSVLQWAGGKVDSMAIDTGNQILTFSLPNQIGASVINHTAGTITAVVAGTRTDIAATFTLSLDATATVGGVAQVSGATENTFTSPVTYTVTAEDGTPKEYVVTVSLATYNLVTASTNATVSVTLDGVPVADGEGVITFGNSLVITATAEDGYTMDSLTVNGVAFVSGEQWVVQGDVSIVGVAIPSSTGTPFESGDTVTNIYFDTSINTTTLNSYLASLTYSDGICNLLAYNDGSSETGILLVVDVDGVYQIAVNDGSSEPPIVYDSDQSIWNQSSVTLGTPLVANVIDATAGWNGEWVSKTEL